MNVTQRFLLHGLLRRILVLFPAERGISIHRIPCWHGSMQVSKLISSMTNRQQSGEFHVPSPWAHRTMHRKRIHIFLPSLYLLKESCKALLLSKVLLYQHPELRQKSHPWDIKDRNHSHHEHVRCQRTL